MMPENVTRLNLVILLFVFLALMQCKKEEIVIVYSKIETVGTSNITSMSADVEGFIEELTETSHNEYGVCWNTERNPTVYDNKAILEGSAQTGSFTVRLYELDPSTTYYVRAFVLDNKKYVYGSEKTFTTSQANLPVVTTANVTGITSKYAGSGGNVTSQGDKPVTAKGVCFDTSPNPTIQKTKTVDGWGTGSFNSTIAGLLPDTKYYVRAYALSEFGVSYGSQQEFTTDAEVFLFYEDFSNNDNGWYTGPIGGDGSISIENGKYIMKYSEEGFLWRSWNVFPGLLNAIARRDFEITTTISTSPFGVAGIAAVGSYLSGGLLWDCDNTSFKFFEVLEIYGRPSKYYYIIGSYDGSWNIWKDYTLFTGTYSNKLSVMKGTDGYYFFINDEKVYNRSYTGMTKDGVGFYVENAVLSVDHLIINQMGDKKSMPTDEQYQIIPIGGNNARSRRIELN